MTDKFPFELPLQTNNLGSHSAVVDARGAVIARGASHLQITALVDAVNTVKTPPSNKSADIVHKIKPLVWEKADPRLQGSHASPMGFYRLYVIYPTGSVWAWNVGFDSKTVATEEDAKAAAENHWRNRIGLALEKVGNG